MNQRSPTQITFDVLARSPNDAALAVLGIAADHAERSLRQAALVAMMRRRSLGAQREVLGRFSALDAEDRALVIREGGRLEGALRENLTSENPAEGEAACRAILDLRAYDLIPSLAHVAEDSSDPLASTAAQTVLELAEWLYAELGESLPGGRRDPQLVRRNILPALESSATRFGQHARPELLEAFLILTGRDNATLMHVLGDPRHSAYVPVVQALTHSKRRGVLRLVLGFLDDPHAPSALMNVLAHRTDRPFIEHLLRRVGHQPSGAAKLNLKHVESIAWLRDDLTLIAELDDAAQHSVVELTVASNMKPAAQFRVIEYLLEHGKSGGRRAAVAALTKFNGADASARAMAAVNDRDPAVQAAALSQLRGRGVPAALSVLLAHIDSPHHVVRAAARESLSEFSFARYLQAYDMLDDGVRVSTGALVRRIDVAALPQLRAELTSPSGKRRMRATAVARSMGVVPQVEAELIALLADTDHLVRSEAANALGDADTPQSREALHAALADNSVVVQEAAQGALDQIAARAGATAAT